MIDNNILKEALRQDYVSKEDVRKYIKLYKEEKNPEKRKELSDTIFFNNIRHIKKISMKFSSMYSSQEDCFQNGVLGFFDALERFDLDKNTAFTTYLYFWVYKYIFEGTDRNSITIPKNVQFMDYSYKKYIELIENEDKNHEEFLNNKLFKSEIFIKKYLSDNNKPDIKIFRIDENIKYTYKDNSRSETRFENLIKDEKISPENCVINKIYDEELKSIIFNKLSKKESDIIFLRYFNDEGDVMTLGDISSKIGITSERVRQIEKKAFRKLRRMFISLRKGRKMEIVDIQPGQVWKLIKINRPNIKIQNINKYNNIINWYYITDVSSIHESEYKYFIDNFELVE